MCQTVENLKYMINCNVIPTLYYDIDSNFVPSDKDCIALWDRYGVFDNIRQHSVVVANFAEALARQAVKVGYTNYIKSCRAGGLLHDIAKSYTVHYGGNHAQLGASWVVSSTGNYRLGQVVLNHVEWKWSLPKCLIHPLFIVMYSDKRVQHNIPVSLEKRYTDLIVRYGKTEDSRKAIYRSWEHLKNIECVLSTQLELPLYEYTLIGRRLVFRT